jgi:ribosome-associated protein
VGVVVLREVDLGPPAALLLEAAEVERVVAALREALRVERPRRPTAPTRASREKRLESKRVRSETKRLRRPPDD